MTKRHAARATSLSAPEDSTPLWLKVAPLLVTGTLIAAVVWYFSWPATAASLYRDIMAVAKDDATGDLSDVESKIDEYLRRFPDGEHHGEVEELREELDLNRLQRKYERRSRLRGAADAWGPVERTYAEATSLASTDPIAAAEQLRALLDVYGEATISDADKRCLNLAREQLPGLEEKGRLQFADQLQAIAQRLDAADAVAAAQPDRAHAIRAGVIALYGTKAWAQPAVQRAQQALNPALPPEQAEDQPH